MEEKKKINKCKTLNMENFRPEIPAFSFELSVVSKQTFNLNI